MLQCAALFIEDQTFFSCYEPRPQEPQSAATQLIQGIFESFPEQALTYLRRPLWLSYPPSLMDRGMIAVAAKRYRFDPHLSRKLSESDSRKQQIRYQLNNNDCFGSPMSIERGLSWLREESKSDCAPSRLYERDREIRALLIDEKHEVLLMAKNGNSQNKTKHAEVVLLQEYYLRFQKGFEQQMTLVTSLQCCKMCAAMVWHMHLDPWKNLKVFYSKPELGPSARDTILTAGGNLRREVARDAQQLALVIEMKLDGRF